MHIHSNFIMYLLSQCKMYMLCFNIKILYSLILTFLGMHCTHVYATPTSPSQLHPSKIVSKAPQNLTASHTQSVSNHWPAVLKSWQPWVEQKIKDRYCAHKSSQALCQWADFLHIHLQLKQNRATFYIRVQHDQNTLLPLPHHPQLGIQSLYVKPITPPLTWDAQAWNQASNHTVWRLNNTWHMQAVIDQYKRPYVALERGLYLIRGDLTWTQLPDFINIPMVFAHVSTQSTPRNTHSMKVDHQGLLWLKNKGQKEKKEADKTIEQDQLYIEVYREIFDEVPLRIKTHVQLNISGKAREVILQGLQIKDSEIVQVDSTLSHQSQTGGIQLYIKPGKSKLVIESLIHRPVQQIKVPQLKGADHHRQEIWMWHNRRSIRQVQLTGLEEIDPEQSNVPSHLATGDYTFLANAQQTLVIKEIQRGLKQVPMNKLKLSRNLWLDLDGRGFVSLDRLSGDMSGRSRFNYAQTGVLGRVELLANQHNSKNTPLLITTDPQSKKDGVEIRGYSQVLHAEARVEQPYHKPLAAVGWDHGVHQLEMNLHVSPGWHLLSIQGAENSTGTWVKSWKLMDFFIILMISAAVFRLFNIFWAVLTLLTLIAYHQVDTVPLWSWIQVLVAMAIAQAIQQKNIFRRMVYMYLAVNVLVFALGVLQSAQQDIRQALHIQLEHIHYNSYSARSSYVADYRSANVVSNSWQDTKSYAPKRRKRAGKISAYKKKKAYPQKSERQNMHQKLQQVDPNAVVQTGPGIPQWNWRSYNIKFAGPVTSERMIKFWLIPPHYMRLIYALRALALLLLGIGLCYIGMRKLNMNQWVKKVWKLPIIAWVMSVVLCMFMSLSLQGKAHAQAPVMQSQSHDIPVQQQMNQVQQMHQVQQMNQVQQMMESNQVLEDTQNIMNASKSMDVPTSDSIPTAWMGSLFPPPALLAEMKEDLLRSIRCQGSCLYVPSMKLTIQKQTLTLHVTVHAQKESALTLPGYLHQHDWQHIQVDQHAAVARGNQQGSHAMTQVRIPRGIHHVRAQLDVGDLQALSLTLHDKPHVVRISLNGWQQQNQDTQKVADTLEFMRIQPQKKSTQSQKSSSIIPSTDSMSPANTLELNHYLITRHLYLSQPWQVFTTVERRRNHLRNNTDVVVVPLLAGERVLSEQVSVSTEGARIEFKEGQMKVEMMSELSAVSEITLHAPQRARWTERWKLTCGVIWQCQTQGLHPIIKNPADNPLQTKEWYPWPNERLTIQLQRPKALKGAATTVQSFTYTFNPGKNRAEGEISINLLASRGGSKTLTLPKQAKQIRLWINQKEHYQAHQKHKVNLPLTAGHTHFKVTWEQTWHNQFKQEIPPVHLNQEIVNFTQKVNRSRNRWLLWTQGLAWGPAVLFWGHLALYMILALVLGRVRYFPLKNWEWFIFLVGFTQVSIVFLLLVVLYFGLISYRLHYAPSLKSKYWFNSLQLFIIPCSLAFIGILMMVVGKGLLNHVDMGIHGMESTSYSLKWYTDRLTDTTPSTAIYSLPYWVWQGFMLLWSLWVVNALIRWSQWVWKAWNTGGLWKHLGWIGNTNENDTDNKKTNSK